RGRAGSAGGYESAFPQPVCVVPARCAGDGGEARRRGVARPQRRVPPQRARALLAEPRAVQRVEGWRGGARENRWWPGDDAQRDDGEEACSEVRGRGEVNEPGWVGIDFGTTNSAVAIADAAGEAHLAP